MTDPRVKDGGAPREIGRCTISGEFVGVGVQAHRVLAALDGEGRSALTAELEALWALRTSGADTPPGPG